MHIIANGSRDRFNWPDGALLEFVLSFVTVGHLQLSCSKATSQSYQPLLFCKLV